MTSALLANEQCPSPLVGEGRGPRAQRVERVRGNEDGLTKRQLLPAGATERSRHLRKTAGEPERRLWRALREALPGGKFRRQVPFGTYHADFCSHSAKLIVEIDGDDHAQRLEKDATRTRFLNDESYRVIRVSNGDVMTNIDGVLSIISTAVATRQTGRACPAAPSPSHCPWQRAPPSPTRGEGLDHSVSSSSTALAPVALSRTVPSSTSATRPSEM